MIRGVDASGTAFEINTVLDNMSADGLYVRLRRQVRLGTKLFIVVQLSTAPAGRGLRTRVGGLPGRRRSRLLRALRWAGRLLTREGLPTPPLSDIGPGPYVALRGVVVRTEPQPGGMYGVAVKFTHHRFL
ncbi:MAG TPA: hypothetical protein VKJ47_22425 [Candidatus Binatia bacterium]|nr:hypothetical protein [Candidatus Binatia bacterium]